MDVPGMLQEHGNRASERVAQHVARHPADLDTLLAAVDSPVKRVKNAAAKAVRHLSETEPALLTPHRAHFEQWMDGADTIVRWIGLDVFANLARADAAAPVPTRIVRRIASCLVDDSMVTASHAIEALGKIAESHGRHRSVATKALASVASIPRNEDCRNILCGRVVQAFVGYCDRATAGQRKTIRSVAETQMKNPIAATRKRAAQLLRRLESS